MTTGKKTLIAIGVGLLIAIWSVYYLATLGGGPDTEVSSTAIPAPVTEPVVPGPEATPEPVPVEPTPAPEPVVEGDWKVENYYGTCVLFHKNNTKVTIKNGKFVVDIMGHPDLDSGWLVFRKGDKQVVIFLNLQEGLRNLVADATDERISLFRNADELEVEAWESTIPFLGATKLMWKLRMDGSADAWDRYQVCLDNK